MLEFFDRDRVPLGRFENAFAIQEQKKLNAVNRLFFSLPKDDPKNEYCAPFSIVAYDKGEKYRIIRVTEDEGNEDINRYECEHVLGLLIDTSMDGFHVVGNVGVYTREVINYVLSFQSDWVLDECDFARQFEYGWEKETLLAALFSVPNRFVEKYIFKTNTTVYPFRLSLKIIDEDAEPKARARKGYNRISLSKEIDYTKIATRLIPYGMGEGDNQLNIASLNGGLRYLQAPASVVNEYGGKQITKIWTDRRYSDQQSLFDAAKALLNELQEPYREYSVDFIDDCDIGDMVDLVGVVMSFVTEVIINYNELVTKAYKVANKTKDVASSIADLADRQNIETNYSQGASQLWTGIVQGNADASDPITFDYEFDDDLFWLNKFKIKIRMSRYRGEVATTSSGGSNQTSSSGGGSSSTSNTGGGASNLSLSMGTLSSGYKSLSPAWSDFWAKTTVTSTINGASDLEDMVWAHQHEIYFGTSGDGSISNFPGHGHDIAHSHSFSIASHSHSFSVPAHTHTLDTTHNHTIEPKFTYYGNATGFWLRVNGVNKLWVNGSSYEGDIVELLKNAQGIIPRGQWITIGCVPNDRARFNISYSAKGFIQSRGGGQY